MAVTDVQLHDPGESAPPRAGTTDLTVLEPWQRGLAGLAAATLGVTAGGCSILAPGLHLVLVWFAPALGIALGLAATRITAWARHTEATCGRCSQPFVDPGPGPVWLDAPTVRCPHCQAAWKVEIPR